MDIIKRKTKCQKIKENLLLMLRTLGIYELLSDSAALYEAGYFGNGTANILN